MCADTASAIDAEPPIKITPAGLADAEAWAAFVRESNDGTLHHELSFLAYHPAGRFNFAPLIARRGGQILTVLPGGLVERDGATVFASPLGASVGGPLIAASTLAETLEIVDALKAHARNAGWAGFEFLFGPTAYQRRISDVMSFALFARGFRLEERHLSFVIPIASATPDSYATLFRKKQAWSVRAAGRRGVTVAHGGTALLEPFLRLFRETYDRHGTSATHSEAEIADLLERLPGRVEITLASLGDAPLAGILVFRLNERAAQTFYICSSKEYAKENGTVAAIAALIDRLSADGVGSLDLGPSASSQRINEGVVFFKEGLGATGQSRDRWTWRASGASKIETSQLVASPTV